MIYNYASRVICNYWFSVSWWFEYINTNIGIYNKKAELSQRRPRDAPNIWGALKNFESPDCTHGYFSPFPEISNGLLFRSILRMYVQNLSFVLLPVPRITGGTQKIWARPFSLKFLKSFVRLDPVNVAVKFEVRSFTRSWDNRVHSKNVGSPWIRPRCLVTQVLRGFCSHGRCEYNCQIWSS